MIARARGWSYARAVCKNPAPSFPAGATYARGVHRCCRGSRRDSDTSLAVTARRWRAAAARQTLEAQTRCSLARRARLSPAAARRARHLKKDGRAPPPGPLPHALQRVSKRRRRPSTPQAGDVVCRSCGTVLQDRLEVDDSCTRLENTSGDVTRHRSYHFTAEVEGDVDVEALDAERKRRRFEDQSQWGRAGPSATLEQLRAAEAPRRRRVARRNRLWTR